MIHTWYRDQGLTTTLFFVVVPGLIKATNVIIADVVIVLYSVNSYTGISFVVVVVSLVFDTRYYCIVMLIFRGP